VSDRVVGAWQFLVHRAREAGVPWPRAFIGVGLSLVLALVVLVFAARRSEKAKPAPPQLAESLARAEQLLSRGELEPARAALQQLESAHPETARVRYLLGNLDYAQGERERALSDYREALRLDPGYGNDAVLRGNVRALVERKSEGPQAIALLAEAVGKPALPDLVACAKGCRDERTRKKAAEAAIRLGGAALVVQETQAARVDDKQAAVDKLRFGRSCRERKVAALELIATGDKRYLDSLRAARERRGGFLGLQDINICMRRELDATIRKWEADK
jgi:tetratricopeptide (TPR) repeat protein